MIYDSWQDLKVTVFCGENKTKEEKLVPNDDQENWHLLKSVLSTLQPRTLNSGGKEISRCAIPDNPEVYSCYNEWQP